MHSVYAQNAENMDMRIAVSTCVICSVVVRILAIGLQHTGSVSSRVGRACVRNGFMYFTSKSPHMRANHALSFNLVPLPLSRDCSAVSYKKRNRESFRCLV
jgi:hypothetical protein